MKVVGELMEVILYVQDMAGQVAFYRDQLGLRVSYPPDAADYAQEMWVTLSTGACTLALHGGGQKRLGPDAPKIVFRVDDIDAARGELIRRGVTVGEVRQAAPGVRVCDAVDPEGNKISLEAHA